MEKDDDEVTIDFSKIKGFFSKGRTQKREENAEHRHAHAEEKAEQAGQHRHTEEKVEQVGQHKHEKAEHRHAHAEEKAEKGTSQAGEGTEEELGKQDAVPKVHHDKPKEVEPSKEDELVLDFSKVKKFFKSDRKQAESKPEIKKADDEVSIDFTKIKGFFKKGKEEAEESDAEPLDWKRISNFFIRYQAIFLILIPLIISMHLRLVPSDLPITKDWATSSVDNYLKSQIRQQVNQQYPNLPDANKEQFVNSEFQKVSQEQKTQIAQQIDATAQYFKSQLQDEHGHTYLPDIDTYYWLRHARNVVEHGFPADKIINGRHIDDHMMAPLGRDIPTDMFHAYLMGYTFNFLHFFDSSFELDRVCFFMPVVVSVLCLFPAFFIARRFGGNFAGFIAAGIIAIHPAFIVRTTAGVCDTDSYNIFFALMIAWLFLEAFESHNKKKMLLLSAAAGFLVGLFSFTWGGWWFIPDFLLASSVLYLVYFGIAHLDSLKKGFLHFLKVPTVRDSLIVIGSFLICSFVFVSLFQSPSAFKSALFSSPNSFSQIKDVATSKVWPNVFTTVAEQNEVDFKGIISNSGGTFLFVVALVGILIAIFRKGPDGKYDPKLAILLTIWFIATMYASTKGVRWVLLLVPALAIAVAIVAGFVYLRLSAYLTKEFGINRIVAIVVVLLLVFVLIFIYPKNMVTASYNTVKQEIPLITRAWVVSLEMINQNATKNAIINSWWDYGHWFKYIADRPVTFDGTSQDTPMAHWIGKVLLTDNEDLAVGILRMLDCGSNKAFEELDKVIDKPYKTVDILDEIVATDKEQARKILRGYGLTVEQIDVVLYYTHCDPPEDFFIASEDMIGKSGVWAHFGAWDFKRATIFNKVRTMDQQVAMDYLKSEFNYSTDAARNLYFEVKGLDPQRSANDWIAPWPSYASNLDSCTEKNSKLECANGLQVDLATYDAFVLTQEGKKHVQELVVPTSDGLFRKKFSNNTISFSAALIPTGGGYQSVIMHPQLAASMFTRLFYMGGHSLSHFTLFTYQRSALGTEVYVYKVNWNGGPMKIIDSVKQQVEATKQLHIRHILVNSSEEANALLARLKHGADFASLAANFSKDTSASRGGDIGWIMRGQTVEPFEAAAFNLSVGQISGIVQTQFGYHIIQLLGMRNQSLPTSS
jgi:dolichyl-diphosphooligosaccharide--protein glycosyltransferase